MTTRRLSQSFCCCDTVFFALTLLCTSGNILSYFFIPSYFFLFVQVLVKLWIDGAEHEQMGGLSAAFGSLLPTNIKNTPRLPATYTKPLNGCSSSSSKVFIPDS